MVQAANAGAIQDTCAVRHMQHVRCVQWMPCVPSVWCLWCVPVADLVFILVRAAGVTPGGDAASAGVALATAGGAPWRNT